MNELQLSKICLVFTSTVYPNSHFVKINDYKVREKQYLTSLIFYIINTNVKNIVVCDNSNFNYCNYNLEYLAKLFNKNIEILSFNGNSTLIKELGKGYGEGEIIEFVFKNSILFSHCISFFKVTGRILVENIDKIISEISYNLNYFNFIRHRLIIIQNKIDTRFYYCTKIYYLNHLIDRYKYVNDSNSFFLEHSYFIIKNRFKTDFYEFPIVIKFSGYSGSHGNSYKDGFLKFHLKLIFKFLKLI
jgi:hypothetical protein